MKHGKNERGESLLQVKIDAMMHLRAQGCLLGQLCGDALGSLVEFQSPEQIRKRYPRGVREMQDGGCWNTIAGQPTDDSELALMLARSLIEKGKWDKQAVRAKYRYWYDSEPFDCGGTIASGLEGRPNPESQANGALMRISPMGIFGVQVPPTTLRRWAMQDAALTHPHPICQQANALFVSLLAQAIGEERKPQHLYRQLRKEAEAMDADPKLLETIQRAQSSAPDDFLHQQGWVLLALQNALWQMLHANNLEEAVVDTIGRGGDTDTNAAICGALMGAIDGIEAIPHSWIKSVLHCRPSADRPEVKHPREECFWPVEALDLAEKLLSRK
jgi:ADP-ribosylglycohydrolase